MEFFNLSEVIVGSEEKLTNRRTVDRLCVVNITVFNKNNASYNVKIELIWVAQKFPEYCRYLVSQAYAVFFLILL